MGDSFPFPAVRERAERLEEAIVVLRKLMSEDGATFAGRHYALRRATYRPRPVQRPYPPIWIGASGERLMLPIVARQADAWHDFGSVSELRRKAALLDELARAAGRDPAAILRSTSLSLSRSWDAVRRTIAAAAEAGFAYLVVSWPTEGEGRLREFVERVMPEFAERRTSAP